ncbi:MAG: glycosyltransferase [Desulfurococcales archaeon]|jgi:glycosyltransferase involved in cell wall biosynthesis|nr:glycosyltransferase [Desulfurococcales archaeon]
MRILVINNGIWPSGAQISTNEFIESLADRAELRILTCYQERFLTKVPALTYRLPCKSVGALLIMKTDRTVEKLVEWADIAWIATGEFALASRIKRIKTLPIVAHLHSYEFLCPFMHLAYSLKEVCNDSCTISKVVKCKFGSETHLITLGAKTLPHGLISLGPGIVWTSLYYAKWRKIITESFNSTDGFIAISRILYELHTQYLYNFKEKPLEVIYNLAIEPLKNIKPSSHEPYGDYVLYASGSNPVKGPHILLEAWREVSREFRDLKLYMIGCRGSWVEKLAKKMSLRNVASFGRLSSDKYYRLMYRARAVVMPSIWPEPFGRIPVEANRLGVPAVVSSAGGLPETIVDGATGYIFKANDVNDLAEKVMKVLERDFDREEIIVHSYERINPQREVEKLIKFFESVISHDRGV